MTEQRIEIPRLTEEKLRAALEKYRAEYYARCGEPIAPKPHRFSEEQNSSSRTHETNFQDTNVDDREIRALRTLLTMQRLGLR